MKRIKNEAASRLYKKFRHYEKINRNKETILKVTLEGRYPCDQAIYGVKAEVWGLAADLIFESFVKGMKDDRP